MAFLFNKTKACGVKIKTIVSGVPSYGSGVIYLTENHYNYNYVLTAKHLFQEDSKTSFDIDKVFNIEVQNFEQNSFKRLQFIPKKELRERVISFEEDFLIIIIDKSPKIILPPIVVSNTLSENESKYYSWGVFTANEHQLHNFELEHNDEQMMRFRLHGNLRPESLPGMSGGGVFMGDRTILVGIIKSYPNKDFQNETVDCTLISFEEVNHKLKALKRATLGTKDSIDKREVENEWVDINQAVINDACLNFNLALKRLKADMEDDWYHDPLKYIDLLNKDYLFKQLGEYFSNKIYAASRAEKFYVPKKKFTLREAQILPFTDRILYMAAVGALAEKMDSAMISNVYSARYNKFSDTHLLINGVEQWKKMQYRLLESANLKNANGAYKYGCIIEIDLLNFYDNINKVLLKEKILRICETPGDKSAAQLIYDLLCGFTKKDVGLPQNSDASALLASFYLNQVDIFMQSHCSYFRFMDDIRIFCSDQYEARRILQTFEFELRRCHLSVNSQKTEIYTLVDDGDEESTTSKKRTIFQRVFDLEVNKISRLRKSANYAYLNEAFHLSLDLLETHLTNEDSLSSDDSARRLNYALNTIAYLGIKNIKLLSEESKLKETIESAIGYLIDRPWITSQLCKVLNLMPSEIIKKEYLEDLKKIVLTEKFNTYSFQTYQVWLLFAKHKCFDFELKSYAVKQIEKNDETNRAVIAAMVIYVCSVDNGYRRVILRKFEEEFTHGYFQNRTALISLRAFPPERISEDKINNTLKFSAEFTHKFKDKDLVFVQGFDEDEQDREDMLDQLYSL